MDHQRSRQIEREATRIAGYTLPERRFGSVVLSGLWKGCEVTPTS
jgi:hypothetical protein